MFQFAFEGALFTLNVNAPLMPVALLELPPTIRRETRAVCRTAKPYTVSKKPLSECLDGAGGSLPLHPPRVVYDAAGISQERPAPMFQPALEGALITSNANAPPMPAAWLELPPTSR